MSSLDKEKEAFWWTDRLRATATISVIVLHTVAPILYQYGHIANYQWLVGNCIDSFLRFCVPVFLMLTGALIIPKKYGLLEFLNKRLSRILLPFLFWSSLYIFYDFALDMYNGHPKGLVEAWNSIIFSFINGSYYHLWYIYMLIFIYPLIPLMSYWGIKLDKVQIVIFFILWSATILSQDLFIGGSRIIYYLSFWGYPLLGHILNTNIQRKPIYTKLSIIVFLGGSLGTTLLTYFFSKDSGFFYDSFYSYLSPNIILASMAIFVFFKSYNTSTTGSQYIFGAISKYSYGIYLSHAFCLSVLSLLGISWSFGNIYIGIPLTCILAILMSLGITYLISHIPYGKYIAG